MLSLTFSPPAKFVRRYADIGANIRQAIGEYKQDVESRSFPTEEESYHLPAWRCSYRRSENRAKMHIIRTVKEMQRACRGDDPSARGASVWCRRWVRCMKGISLWYAALVSENDVVAASIFVNPLQFATERRPLEVSKRTFHEDCAQLLKGKASPCVFAPTAR